MQLPPSFVKALYGVASVIATVCSTLAVANTFPKWTPVFVAISTGITGWLLPNPKPSVPPAPVKDEPKE